MGFKFSKEDRNTKLYIEVDEGFYTTANIASLKEEILEYLETRGLQRYSVKKIQEMLDKKDFGQKVLIGEGKLPEEGYDGYIKYGHKFLEEDAEIFSYLLEKNEEESIEAEKIFTLFNQNSLVAELILPQEGKGGVDILEGKIPAKKVKPATLKAGKNIYLNKEQDKAYAEIEGIVCKDDNGLLAIEPLTVIDSAEGEEIEIEGSLIIDCSMIIDCEISATGSIILQTNVSGSKIKAGRNIYVNGGFSNNSEVTAKGNIVARFVDASKVKANYILIKEHMYNAEGSAISGIDLKGGKAAIIGGEVHSYGSIKVKDLGSEKNIETTIVIGLTSYEVSAKGDLQGECLTIKKNMSLLAEKIEQYTRDIFLRRIQKREISSKIVKELTKAQEKFSNLQEVGIAKIKENQEKIAYYDSLSGKAGDSQIIATGKIYPGVRIYINGKLLEIVSVLTNRIFQLQDNVVIY